MAARTFREKKVVSFSALFFMCTLTWITEKELERVIESSLEEKHGNSKRWLAASKEEMSDSEK